MRRFLLLLLLLSGCTTQSQIEGSDRRFAGYENERAAYFTCGARQARSIVSRNPSADPGYVAIAARSRCSSERAAMINGIERSHNVQIWGEMIAIMDRKFDEGVVASVL